VSVAPVPASPKFRIGVIQECRYVISMPIVSICARPSFGHPLRKLQRWRYVYVPVGDEYGTDSVVAPLVQLVYPPRV